MDEPTKDVYECRLKVPITSVDNLVSGTPSNLEICVASLMPCHMEEKELCIVKKLYASTLAFNNPTLLFELREETKKTYLEQQQNGQ